MDIEIISNEEANEAKMKRLCDRAGGVVSMLLNSFKTPKGIDIKLALLFASGLAGVACHQAVIADEGEFQIAETNDGKRFYFGEDINKYLFENETSIYSFCNALGGIDQAQLVDMVGQITGSINNDNRMIWNLTSESVYKHIMECWDKNFEAMILANCEKPSEWPILIGIALQNIMLEAGKAAPKEEVARMAMECVIKISMMRDDSI
ncbi:MAG: hypothetical protein MJ130_04280 [Lachnospiraceae bacterium]|nr:hypothetical protein [Lachnospiraceae bacterium]